MIDGVRVTTADVSVSNEVINVIDAVVMPKNNKHSRFFEKGVKKFSSYSCATHSLRCKKYKFDIPSLNLS